MTFEECVQKFIDKQSYLTNGAGLLSTKWGLSRTVIKAAKKEARSKLEFRNKIHNAALYKTLEKNIDLNSPLIKLSPKKENKGKLKSRWQNAGGKWLESYEYGKDGADSLDIEGILSSIDFNNVESVDIPQVTDNKRVLNLYLSDQHIGASVTNGLYTNHFDDKVYLDRVMDVYYWVVRQVDTYGAFDKINILYLGDTFDGQDGFTVKRTHNLPQNMSNNEAFETAIKTELMLLDALVYSKTTNKINIHCVSDSNHGGSMDYYLFKSLQEIIKYKYPQISFTIADKFLGWFQEGIHTFIYTHGKDGKDMKFGLPLDLNDKTENFINQYIDNYELDTQCVHVVKGDLHQDATSTAKKFRYRNVPSLFGSSGWIMKNYGNTKPGVGYDIFNPNEDDLMSGVIKFKT